MGRGYGIVALNRTQQFCGRMRCQGPKELELETGRWSEAGSTEATAVLLKLYLNSVLFQAMT